MRIILQLHYHLSFITGVYIVFNVKITYINIEWRAEAELDNGVCRALLRMLRHQ